MRFVTFTTRQRVERFGMRVADGRLLDLEGSVSAHLATTIPTDRACAIAHALAPPDARAFIAGGAMSLDAARHALRFAESLISAGKTPAGPRGELILFNAADVTLNAPVPRPNKFIAAGKNYFAHQKEMQQRTDPTAPQLPIAHVQFASTIVGPDATVHFPPETTHLDYEVEIGVVIGRPAFRVSREEALDYVFGYTVFNDISDRDTYRGERFKGGGIGLLGKNFAGFSPLGPDLCTADEIGDPQALGLRSRVNGERRQDSNSSLMMFKIAEQVAHWSHIGLEPGDMLGSGTPGGVAAGRKPGEAEWWLKPGDVVECEVDGIGVLTTHIA